MRKLLSLLIVLTVLGCGTPASDGFPVVKAPIAGHVLSCKGMRCCWPWDENGQVYVCIEPLEGNYLGAGGVMIELRGRMP